MPAAVTHYLLAQKVLENIKLDTKLIVDEKIFFYGAQGPDFLFTHRFLPWQKGVNIREYANKIHNAEPNQTLRLMKEFIMQNKSVKATSYFLGFICHYSLDSTAHPFIEYITNQQLEEDNSQSEKVFHCESEAVLDTIVYYKETGKLASKLNMGKFYDYDEKDKLIIARIYKYVIDNLFNENIDVKLLEQSIEDSKGLFSLMSDKSGIKKTLIGRMEKNKKRNLSSYLVPNKIKNNVDYVNIDREIWYDRKDNERNESFFDLFSKAEEKAISIITNLNTRPIDSLSNNEGF